MVCACREILRTDIKIINNVRAKWCDTVQLARTYKSAACELNCGILSSYAHTWIYNMRSNVQHCTRNTYVLIGNAAVNNAAQLCGLWIIRLVFMPADNNSG
jgi:hypothetical protein